MTTILVSTWEHGLLRVDGTTVSQELDAPCVRSPTDDGAGGVLAVVGGHSLYRRYPSGEWTDIAWSHHDLSCCVASGDAIFVGTDDARMMRIDVAHSMNALEGFDRVAGRDTWYAGQAIVDGQPMGPPLGVRSVTATCDGVVLVNVHVGGIPRSTDGGATWAPTLDVDADAHQVLAHPTRPDLAIAAAAVGLCVSRDGGATWRVEQEGLHATHGLAVAFGQRDLFISTAVDPFSDEGAVYRRPIDGEGPLERVGGGLPQWIAVDTDCMATRGPMAAIVDKAGRLFASEDDGATWSSLVEDLPFPSGLFICRAQS
jgi:hypothetical protein